MVRAHTPLVVVRDRGRTELKTKFNILQTSWARNLSVSPVNRMITV